MNIKRFVAADMREALRAVRAELGPDAVMLSSRGIDGGVEVVAAVDYDDGLFAAVGDAFGTGASDASAPASRPAETAPALGSSRPAPADDPVYAAPLDEYRRISTTVDDDEEEIFDADDDEPEQDGHDSTSRAALARAAAARIALVIGGDRAARAPRPAPHPLAAAIAPPNARAAAAAQPDAERVAFVPGRPSAPAAPADGRGAAMSPAAARGAASHAGSRAAASTPADDWGTDVPRADARGAAGAASPSSSSSADAETERLRSELKDLRQLLETQLASLAWNDLNRRTPARARVLRQFAEMGVDASLARELAGSMKDAQSMRDAWRLPLSRFADRLPLAARDLADLGGVYAFVGPTGVGKTTTIAKIAARHVMKHGADSIALISTDTYRIGARDQLLTFARILGTPMHGVTDADDLARVLDGLRDKKLVLIDTAGMSQRDVRLAEQFATLRVEGGDVRSVLVLSAATQRAALDEAMNVFRAADPKALVVTKIDEAALLGPVLSLAIECRLPLVYLSDGQRVPEDLHVAGSKRVWLMQTAVRCLRNRPSQLSEDDLAERFGSPELAARLGADELADMGLANA